MIDTILYNGNIITLDDHAPRVNALAISMGRVVATGSDDDILPLATASTHKFNLSGKLVRCRVRDYISDKTH